MDQRENEERPQSLPRISRKKMLMLMGATGVGWMASRLSPLSVAGEASAAADPAGGWLNVRDYGAKGDNKADDAPAIRKAVKAALVSQGVVYLPKGTYVLRSPIEVTGAVALVGAGKDATILRMAAKNADGIQVTGSNARIAHLQVRDVQNTVGGENAGIHVLRGNDNVIEHCRIVNSDDSGIRIGYSSNASAAVDCRVLYCDVENTRRGSGIEVIRSDRTTVHGCAVSGSFQHGIRVCGGTNAIVTNNAIADSKFSDISVQGFGNGSQITHPARGFLVAGNRCQGRKDNIGISVFNNAENGVIEGNLLDGQLTGIKIYDPGGYGNAFVQFNGNQLLNQETPVHVLGSQRRLSFRGNAIAEFRRIRGDASIIAAFDVEGDGRTLELTIEQNDIIGRTPASGVTRLAVRAAGMTSVSSVWFRYNHIHLAGRSGQEPYWRRTGQGHLLTDIGALDTNAIEP